MPDIFKARQRADALDALAGGEAAAEQSQADTRKQQPRSRRTAMLKSSPARSTPWQEAKQLPRSRRTSMLKSSPTRSTPWEGTARA